MKGLKELNKIAVEMGLRGYNKPMEEFAIIEKELKEKEKQDKALEIIRKHDLYCDLDKLTKKEKELLEEVLQ